MLLGVETTSFIRSCQPLIADALKITNMYEKHFFARPRTEKTRS